MESTGIVFTGLLRTGRSLTVIAPAAGFVLVNLSRNSISIQSTQLSNGQSQIFGAYFLDVQFQLAPLGGAAQYQEQEAAIPQGGVVGTITMDLD